MSDAMARRDVLRLLGTASLVTVAATGCDALSTDPTAKKVPSNVDGANAAVKEAPILAERVRKGELPKLAERLPRSPLIVEPVERAGTYGGTWRMVSLGPDSWYSSRILADHLMRWSPDATTVIPNVAESVDVEADGGRYTFHLRPGLRWSDGEPFTAADVVFAVKDVLLNKELYPAPPTWLVSGNQPAQVSAPDDHTVVFVFPHPYGLFLQQEAGPGGEPLTALPRHYLTQFHKAFGQDVDAQAKKDGFDDWTQNFLSKANRNENPPLPTLCAWQPTTVLGKGGRVLMKRNPYYWKTDPDGRQLPYIDEIALELINDNQLIVLKAMQGEIDMQIRYLDTLRNKPVLARNRTDGEYRLFDVARDQMNTMVIALNLAHKDPVKRAVFTSKAFRVGLSHAIDREEIIVTAYQRQGEPWQVAPRKGSAFYDEEMAKQYTEYDVRKANDHLDAAGFTERDGEGIRLGPDGRPIRVTIEFSNGLFPEWADALDLVKRYWRAVGVDTYLKGEDRSLFTERLVAGDHDAGVWQGDGGSTWAALIRPYWYIPFDSAYSVYAPVWAQWYFSGGKEGQEPPEWCRRQLALYDELSTTANQRTQVDLMKQILQISKEQFPAMGIGLPAQSFGVVKNNFHNVPDGMLDEYLFGTPAQSNPQQYFISR